MMTQRPPITPAPITNVTKLNYASDQQIADFFHSRLERALAKAKGDIAVAFPGGSTPGPILDLLAQRELAWNRITVLPTDDRMVEEGHAASNTGKLRAQLEPLGVTIQPLSADMEVPRLAIVWLGMGADGHIASLFPSSRPDPADAQKVRTLTPDPLPPEAPFDRITLTIPALLACDEMAFVVRGNSKRTVFEGALRGEHDLPIRTLLAARDGGHARGTMPVTCFF